MQQQQQKILVTMPMQVNYVPILQPQVNQFQTLTIPFQIVPQLPLRLCEKTMQLVPCQYTFDPVTNQPLPWEGYSFVDTRTGQVVSSSQVKSMSPSVSISRSPSPCISRESTPEPPSEKPKKFGYLSKQNKIKKVHSRVEEYFKTQKLLVGENEILRGEDVVRVHVKNYQGLNQIEETLQLIERTVPINKVHTPISMKNERQMKGFIVYLKLKEVEDVARVRMIFNNNDFKKCDVALPREQAQELKNDSLDSLSPLKMSRRLSAGAA